MSTKKEMERLEKLEAEAAALDQRIVKLEDQISELAQQGREAYRTKNLRTAKEKARCLKVLGKQLDQLSAMACNYNLSSVTDGFSCINDMAKQR